MPPKYNRVVLVYLVYENNEIRKFKFYLGQENSQSGAKSYFCVLSNEVVYQDYHHEEGNDSNSFLFKSVNILIVH